MTAAFSPPLRKSRTKRERQGGIVSPTRVLAASRLKFEPKRRSRLSSTVYGT